MTFNRYNRLALASMFVVAAFAATDAAFADGKPRIVVTPGPPQPFLSPSPEFIPTPPSPVQGFPPSSIEPLPPLTIYTTPLVVGPSPHAGQGSHK